MHSLFLSDDDWKSRVLARIELTPSTYDQEPLKCDRWVTASLLQKSIRRGDTQLALRASFHLSRLDRAYTWRRLLIIAFEDVGAAEPDALVETVAVATSPKWRSKRGEPQSLAHAVKRLAEAPKDRSADYLITAAGSHPSLDAIREAYRGTPLDERLAFVGDGSQPLSFRALAAWLSSGIETRTGLRIGPGDLLRLARLFVDLGSSEELVLATILAAKRTRETFVLMVPLIWLETRESRSTKFSNDPLPESAVIDGIPAYAFDKHTRLGLRSIQELLRNSIELRKCLEDFVAKPNWRASAQMAAFYTDGHLIARRLDWCDSQSLEALGIESDFCRVGVPPEGVAPLRKVIGDSLSLLNEIRGDLWAATRNRP